MEKLLFGAGFSSIGRPLRILFGYRPAEFGTVLKYGEFPDESFYVTELRAEFFDSTRRDPVMTSLGCDVVGAVCPFPDLNHGPSILAGCTKRVAAKMPEMNRATLRRFKRFVKRYRETFLQHLTIDSNEEFDFEEWITNAPYTQSRKNELRRVKEEGLSKKPNIKVKAFVKREFYSLPKHLRGIYSRHDDYKVRVGPYYKIFGDKLFSGKHFIKKIPGPERPQALLDKLGKFKKIFCTDFSQYEATFVSKLFSIELDMYRWSLRNHPRQKEIVDLLSLSTKTNNIHFKTFSCRLRAKRMSGEMNTSCGNGLMNLLITMFVLQEAGNDLEKVDGYFEGDDGIVGCTFVPTAAQYSELGAIIKIEIPNSISEASFCGNIFDQEALHNVTNPKEASVCFGWTDIKYANSGDDVKLMLLRSKGLSMLYEFPGCPILRSLAMFAIRNTASVVSSASKRLKFSKFVVTHAESSYHVDKAVRALENDIRINVDIHDNTRALVHRLYGIDGPKQIELEKYLDNLNEIVPLNLDLAYDPSWYKMANEYIVDSPGGRAGVSFVKTGYTTLAYLQDDFLSVYRH